MPMERVKAKHEDCPFCGGEVDAEGWLDGEGNRGPECSDCGATARSLKRWNTRVQRTAQETKSGDSNG